MPKLLELNKLTVAEEARARLQLVVDAETGNRASAMDDVKFAAGDQWPIEIKMQRQLDRRPMPDDQQDRHILPFRGQQHAPAAPAYACASGRRWC